MTPPRNASPTIKQLAALLGLSHSTVSRALNDRPGIHRETRTRVKAEAARLGYVANDAARMLKDRLSSVIGLVVPNIRNKFYSGVAKIMADAASKQSCQVMLFTTDDDPVREAQAVHSLVGARAKAIVIAATAAPAPEAIKLLQTLRVIQLNRRHPAIAAPVVAVDDALGIQLATAHLLALGHRDIAYIGAPVELSTGRHRLDGFLRALAEAGLQPREDRIVLGSPYQEVGAAGLGRVLAARPRPTALVVGSPEQAEGVLQEASRRGTKVPRELSVVCYGDRSWYELVFGGVTAVRLPEEEIARTCVELLFMPPAARQEDVVLQPVLVVRHSAVKPPAAPPASRRGSAR
ncbi:MAG: LacI family DNA-binding transcriptional regulator [Holophaga sp.]|nr:LacI family DNA-binding transcriptional regulator [Holophaga sp.]